MKAIHLSSFFSGVAAKRLSAVESKPEVSNQHEFNGVSELKTIFGSERITLPVRYIWFGENEGEGISDEGSLTWYDAREKNPNRSEFRMYYNSNHVIDIAKPGDLLIIARTKGQDSVLVVVVAKGSPLENQLLWLFGVSVELESSFRVREMDKKFDREVDYAVRFILDELGIEIEEPDSDELDKILLNFGSKFPSTSIFSQFARNTLKEEVSPFESPDEYLLACMSQEERLFKRLERHQVSEKLQNGFMENGEANIEGFISFSLSIQNRRKSRVGFALENHLSHIFSVNQLDFSRGEITENRSKPDFLFPSIAKYRDASFPANRLTMLGSKSTCKDRWRQVLSEAERIKQKHLLTLEPGISQNQTNEMQAHHLQLVVPKPIHRTYSDTQQKWLMSLRTFIDYVRKK
jgi:hypothetical protein